MLNEYTYKEAVKRFNKLMYQTINNGIPIKIHNRRGKSVYLISEDEYISMEEALFLLNNPANAEHLLSALKEPSIIFESIEELKNELGI